MAHTIHHPAPTAQNHTPPFLGGFLLPFQKKRVLKNAISADNAHQKILIFENADICAPENAILKNRMILETVFQEKPISENARKLPAQKETAS